MSSWKSIALKINRILTAAVENDALNSGALEPVSGKSQWLFTRWFISNVFG